VDSLRSKAVGAGWLREGERLLARRLACPPALADAPGIVHEHNRAARDAIVAAMLDGSARPEPSRSYLGVEPDVTLGEVDRYGIPFRTVLGSNTGLLRADPYYSERFLIDLWTNHLRSLYRVPGLTHGGFLADQIRRAEPVLRRVAARLPPGSAVADVGCGMGGMLVPFKFHGCRTIGCDYGVEYADLGRSLGLDLGQWYGGDLLRYLQNANRWHFTAGTLGATLRRAGLRAVECDERITCLASPAPADAAALPSDGPAVVAEIERLELALATPG
jgi:hypothetical protein